MSLLGLLAVALALSALQAAAFQIFGLKSLKYRRYFSERAVYEGGHVDLLEEISNAKPLPVPWLRVEARMSRFLRFKRQENLVIADDTYHRSVFSLGPWRKITRTHSVSCIRRGCYSIETVALSCGDLFGFAGRSQTLENPAELIVYPHILDFSALRVPSRRWQGDAAVRRFIEPDPFLVSGIRPFMPGDMLKDIHWAATARTGALQVKTRDYTASPRLLLILNVQLSEDQWGELNEEQALAIERGVALAATFAEWAVRNGIETGFLCNGRYSAMDDRAVEAPMGAGPAHHAEILEAMARMKILRRRSFAQYLDDEVLPRGITGADILLISSYWNPALEELAERLRHMENSATWIDPEGGGTYA